jgi:hypothetical protein
VKGKGRYKRGGVDVAELERTISRQWKRLRLLSRADVTS